MNITFKPRLRVTNYFGGCPECGATDGFMNVGGNHWFVCDTHQTRWPAGYNLFSCWKDEHPDVHLSNALRLEGEYICVEPLPCTDLGTSSEEEISAEEETDPAERELSFPSAEVIASYPHHILALRFHAAFLDCVQCSYDLSARQEARKDYLHAIAAELERRRPTAMVAESDTYDLGFPDLEAVDAESASRSPTVKAISSFRHHKLAVQFHTVFLDCVRGRRDLPSHQETRKASLRAIAEEMERRRPTAMVAEIDAYDLGPRFPPEECDDDIPF